MMTMMRTAGLLALLAVCTGSIHGVEKSGDLAQGADTLARHYDLNEVVVTATRTPLSIKETPVLTRVISAREIERSGLKNIQEVLETELAGVEFHQTGYGESISFQGLDARYLLFLVDGERVAGETYGNIDYGRIPLNNVERIEIVRGASSVLYGSNAMGAVVNIITKTPDRPVRIVASGRIGTNYEKNDERIDGLKMGSKLDIPNINADLYAGFDFGQLKSQTTVSYIGTDAYMLFSEEAEVRHYDRLQVIDRTSMPPKSEFREDVTLTVPIDTLGLSINGSRSVNLTQRLDYRFDPRWNAYVVGGYYQRSRYGFPQSQNTGEADGVYTWETYHTYNLQGGVEFNPNDRHRIALTYNTDRYEREMDSLQYSVPKQKHSLQNPRLLWTGRLGAYNRMTAGLEYTNEKLNYDLSSFGYTDRRDLNTASAYVQDELTTNTPLSFTAGVRADYSDRFDWNFIPKVSAKYSVGNCSARVNYSEGYRNPTLKELYMKFLIPNGGSMHIVGNPDLKPEYNRYLSLAAEYLIGFTHISVSGYMSWFRDKIDAVVEGELSQNSDLVYRNIDKSRFSGIEVMAKARLFSGFFVTANYNYVHQTEDAPDASSQQYVYVSPHTATLQLDYRFNCGWRDFGVRLSGRYIGEKEYKVGYQAPFTLPGEPGKLFRGDSYTATHEAYTLWDLTASAQLTRHLTLQCGVNNLFDYQAPVINFNSCMSPGRNGFAKLIFTFE
ncbi:TonB-dependent receptor [Alistipes sp. OttesenSCG-928-L06]|nr:TonB-dependent receptor [Alistipes sp. OttesenSCG-928-L06]